MTDSDKKTIIKKSVSHSNYLILHPHITEKAQNGSVLRQYIFKVVKNANKSEVKKIIEKIYKVKVDKVMIINTHSKTRRLGRTVGKKPGFKKAIVVLKEGESLELTTSKK